MTRAVRPKPKIYIGLALQMCDTRTFKLGNMFCMEAKTETGHCDNFDQVLLMIVRDYGSHQCINY